MEFYKFIRSRVPNKREDAVDCALGETSSYLPNASYILYLRCCNASFLEEYVILPHKIHSVRSFFTLVLLDIKAFRFYILLLPREKLLLFITKARDKETVVLYIFE